MQFYIIAMTLLVLSTMYFYTAVMILGVLLVGSIIFSGYISNIYEYVLTVDPVDGFVDVFYTPPWMRIIPYIIGIIAGYVLVKLNNNLMLKRKIVILCWCIFCFMSTCNVFVSFVLYHKRFVLFTAIYVALHRLFSAIGMAWIVIACCTKHGGIVNKLLSFKVWIPLSRLTYCAYLLNPVIMRSICLYSETSIHFEIPTWFVLIVGYI
ncbi:PREDICTED: nose resistant to fluoxetine protein 6-like, partial [Wasmannia auropunctata]|uniref:nose resistant to fluoxetine protein 6-like n=1 Tax=Wasmannia auropunctata TaxID=64793 RepID=UPI0005EFD384